MAAHCESQQQLIDNLESAFQDVVSFLAKPEFEDASDEIKSVADKKINKFLDYAKETEKVFALRWKQIADESPDFVLQDELQSLRSEFERKQILLGRHRDKLRMWRASLSGGEPPSPGLQQLQPPRTPVMVQPGATRPGVATAQSYPPPGTPSTPPRAAIPEGPLAFLEQAASNIGR